MKITEIAFSTYPVTDILRAKSFYESVLGLAVTSEANMGAEGHWIEYDIGAGTLAIGCAPGWKPSPDGCAVGLEVAEFDEAVAALKAANVTVKMEPFETPVCRMMMIADPDGNIVIIHKRKPGHQ